MPSRPSRALARGDRAAHAELYAAFAGPVFTLARRMLASKALAEDVLQETFVEVLCKIAGFRGEAEVGTWIKRIAINKCLMHVRSSWVSRRGPEGDEPAAEHRSGALDQQLALERALDQVARRRACRRVAARRRRLHACRDRPVDGPDGELLEVAARASARAPARVARRCGGRERDEPMHDGTEDLLKLRELPELPPPPGVWERVLEAERARAAARRFWRRATALAAVAAVVAVTASRPTS